MPRLSFRATVFAGYATVIAIMVAFSVFTLAELGGGDARPTPVVADALFDGHDEHVAGAQDHPFMDEGRATWHDYLAVIAPTLALSEFLTRWGQRETAEAEDDAIERRPLILLGVAIPSPSWSP